MPNEDEFVEFTVSGNSKYRVRKSEMAAIPGKTSVLMLPNGALFDLSQMYLDTTDRHGNPLETPRLAGTNPEYEVAGQLPAVRVVKAEVAW